MILYGEPGTGKTLLAKAVANQTSATFLRVVGSELIQKYLGDGPKLVRVALVALSMPSDALSRRSSPYCYCAPYATNPLSITNHCHPAEFVAKPDSVGERTDVSKRMLLLASTRF